MVAQSVLRDARLVAALAAAAASVLARPAIADEPQAPPRTEAIVIDLSGGPAEGRAELLGAVRSALTASAALRPVTDDNLAAALVGEVTFGAEGRGREALAAASKATSCAEIEVAATLALLELGAAQAGGVDVRSAVRLAYTSLFRCAHKVGNAGSALETAQRLRRLGQASPPSGVDDATWSLYPDLDAAANVTLAALTIETEKPGASVFIDHVERGKTPLAIHIAQGEHLIAVGTESGIAAKKVDITSWSHKERFAPAAAVGRWSRVAEVIVAMRNGAKPADGKAIAEAMQLTGSSLAIVIVSGGTIEAWQAAAGGGASRLGQRRDAAQAAALLEASQTRHAGPDPSQPLLRETDAEREARKRGGVDQEKPAKWWVYAAVVGAAALGAGIIIFGTSGDDTQRFEITLP